MCRRVRPGAAVCRGLWTRRGRDLETLPQVMPHIEAEQLRPSLSSSRYWMAPRMGSLSVAWCCRAVFDRRGAAGSQSDEVGDLVDVTTLAVALIGVGGTLGGTLGGALLSRPIPKRSVSVPHPSECHQLRDPAAEGRNGQR